MKQSGVKSKGLKWLVGGLLLVPKLVMALPQGGHVMHGNAHIHHQGDATTVTQTSDKAIIHWKGMDLDQGQYLHFQQPNSQAAILNRVHGALPSQLNGLIFATGNVII